MKVTIKKLVAALQDAQAHLQYTGYGDSWERQGWQKLDNKITKAIDLGLKTIKK